MNGLPFTRLSLEAIRKSIRSDEREREKRGRTNRVTFSNSFDYVTKEKKARVNGLEDPVITITTRRRRGREKKQKFFLISKVWSKVFKLTSRSFLPQRPESHGRKAVRTLRLPTSAFAGRLVRIHQTHEYNRNDIIWMDDTTRFFLRLLFIVQESGRQYVNQHWHQRIPSFAVEIFVSITLPRRDSSIKTQKRVLTQKQRTKETTFESRANAHYSIRCRKESKR